MAINTVNFSQINNLSLFPWKKARSILANNVLVMIKYISYVGRIYSFVNNVGRQSYHYYRPTTEQNLMKRAKYLNSDRIERNCFEKG